MVRHPRPPSQTWRTFLANHADGLASIDMFVVPTATFRVLYAFIVLRHERRRVVHFDVTSHPTAAWLKQQIVEAFPWGTAPQYLIRDRDAAYGTIFRDRLETMSIVDLPTALRSPWQNAYVERVIGSIRRECLDHVIVLNARHLRRILSSYFDYYPPIPDPPVARQRLPRSASCLSAGCGQDCSFPATRRPSSSVRKARGLIRAAIGFDNAVAVNRPGQEVAVAPRVLFRAQTRRFDEAPHKAWQPADRRSALYPPQRHG